MRPPEARLWWIWSASVLLPEPIVPKAKRSTATGGQRRRAAHPRQPVSAVRRPARRRGGGGLGSRRLELSEQPARGRHVGRVDVDVADQRPGRVGVGHEPGDDHPTVVAAAEVVVEPHLVERLAVRDAAAEDVDAFGRRAGVDGVEGERPEVVDRRGLRADSAGADRHRRFDRRAMRTRPPSTDDTLGPQPSGVLGLVAGHEAAVGRDDPPPGQVVPALASSPPTARAAPGKPASAATSP